jgi:geranylgeranyl pyrophosphate synthase
VTTVLEDRCFDRVSEAEILDLVDSSGTVEEVREMAEGYASQARNELGALPGGEPLEALEFAADFVLRRRR